MKRTTILGLLMAITIFVGWLAFQNRLLKSEGPSRPATENGLPKAISGAGSGFETNILSGRGEPKTNYPIDTAFGFQNRHLFKATNYPPQTTEEKEQWAWWQAMEKSDPKFEWKMPIEFYGRVVDQFNEPVAEAEVVLNWTTVIGPIPDPKKTLQTDSEGRFSVNGIQGKRLWISIDHDGYVPTRDSIASFEYAAFYDSSFYVPNPIKPVVFHLHRLIDPEPLYVFSPYGKIEIGGPPLILDVQKGKVGNQGDLAFTVHLTSEVDNHAADYIVTVQGLNGATLVMSDEEFLSKAPESGYQSMLSTEHRSETGNNGPEQSLHFYVKTASGKYASVGVAVKLWNNRQKADWEAGIYYNPSGSRNLEFDQDKWINK